MEKQECTKIVQEDGTIITFIPSNVDEDMFHVIIEFDTIGDYDNNYLSKADIIDIYDVSWSE